MRKRRIWLIAVIIALFAVTTVLGLSACKDKGDGETPGGTEVPVEPGEETEVVYYDGETALFTALTTALSNDYTFSAEVERAYENGREIGRASCRERV